MLINKEKVRQLRTERGWTQAHLAELCDVSLRTIQRIENQGSSSAESLMALSAVFEVEQVFFADNIEIIQNDRSTLSKSLPLIIIAASMLTGGLIGAAVTYSIFV